MLPQDNYMLLSFINMKLRDFYDSLDSLCDDLDESKSDIMDRLKSINYIYDEKQNKFIEI
ncbi:MAG: DUF4250 domain-containing protein [Acholeplasmatales bacterium]|nr:DUF4250 domain-containing protein [Acholeplasmatales bacterium]